MKAAQEAFDAAKEKASVDKSALNDAIAAATADKTGTAVSADGKDLADGTEYATPEEAQKLADAIAAAQEVADDPNATQDEVDAAAAAVKAAQEAFDAAKKTAQAGAKDISNATVSPIADQTWTGKPVTPAVTVTMPDGTVLTAGTDYELSYANNVDAGTATVTVTGKGDYAGKVNETFKIKMTVVPMYRLYNPNSGEHFYTADKAEVKVLVNAGWNYEGIAWWAPVHSNTPVYRLYNPYAGDHHYTTSAAERDNLVKVGWRDEGIGWYSDDAKTVTLYREYNPNAVTGTHNYTSDKSEHKHLVEVGWKDEGIGWYGVNPADYGINPKDAKYDPLR